MKCGDEATLSVSARSLQGFLCLPLRMSLRTIRIENRLKPYSKDSVERKNRLSIQYPECTILCTYSKHLKTTGFAVCKKNKYRKLQGHERSKGVEGWRLVAVRF